MKIKRKLLLALGLGLLVLAQLACESATGPGLTCNPPQAKVCHVDESGVQVCWCQ